MSRRRRRDEDDKTDLHSEDESQEEKGSGEVAYESGTDTENEDLDVSEYESLDEKEENSTDEEDDKEQEEEVTKETEAPPVEVAQEEGEDVESEHVQKEDEDVSETRRESGDGKEQSDSEQHKQELVIQTEADEEEEKIKEDPAFIPTKGAFFQHDLRSDNQSRGRGRERKVWDKGPVKWSHDMFIMEEQMPKTREILISEYGYDIRSNDVATQPSSDARRARGRGRGGFRGRRARPQPRRGDHQNSTSNQQYNNSNTDYQEDYPTLDKNTDFKHRTKNYWKSDYRPEDNISKDISKPSKNPPLKEPKEPEQSASEETSQVKVETSSDSSNTKEQKFSGLLDVINSHEKGPSSDQTPSKPSDSRHKDRNTRNYQKSNYSNYQESHKPRRYSSLRQRSANSPVDKQMTNQYQRGSNDPPRYSNFAKPMQPNQNFKSRNYAQQNTTNSTQQQVISEETVQTPNTNVSVVDQQTTVSSQPHTPTHQPPPVTYNGSPPTNLGAPMDLSGVPVTPMGLPYNPMYLELEAAYNRRMMSLMMQQQMSQMSLDHLQHPPPNMPQQLDSANTAIPPEARTLPPPGHMQVNPLMPQVSQGSLGSVMRPPPPPMNQPTYFSGNMGMNLGMPQHPFPYPPNLMAQQVGGVTYFNTTPSPPTLPQAPNQQGSPRRPNAAIPIMSPMLYGPGMIEYSSN